MKFVFATAILIVVMGWLIILSYYGTASNGIQPRIHHHMMISYNSSCVLKNNMRMSWFKGVPEQRFFVLSWKNTFTSWWITSKIVDLLTAIDEGLFCCLCVKDVLCIKISWWQGSWGQHEALRGPTGPRWAPCWPHEPCYLGMGHTSVIVDAA